MEKLSSSNFWLSLSSSAQAWLISELPGIIILTISVIIFMKLLTFAVEKLKIKLIQRAENDEKVDTGEAEKRINTLAGIIQGIVKIFVLTTFFVMLLGKFGVNIAPILASAGIIGLAIGFGAQELVRDFISGFFLLLENRVRTGDVAIINGTGGLVEKIELRTITLRDYAGVVHVFQNGKINTLSNMTKDWSAAVFDIGVAYKEDVDRVINIMKKVGQELQLDPEYSDKILEPIEVAGLDQFGDSALVIKARLKTKPIVQWTVGREYRKRLKMAFDEHGIEIPFPHTTIYWGDKIDPLKLKMDVKDPALENVVNN